ncbi:MAG: sulfotransferase family protein [Aggregatilineales bacterium]
MHTPDAQGQLPDFLIIGAARAGTTSLYEYLRQHPDIFMPERKEPHFFTFMNESPTFTGLYDYQMWARLLVTDPAAYRALFAGQDDKICGEASTNYLYYHERTAPRIQEFVPQMKLIIILRNPVERAFSAYQQRRANYRDPLSFVEALAAERGRIAAGWGAGAHYVRGGFYHAALTHYFERFPESQRRVYLYEADFLRHRADMLRDIFVFLGVAPDADIDMTGQYNASHELRHPALRFSHRVLLYTNLQGHLQHLLPAPIYNGLRERMYALRRADAVKATFPEVLRGELIEIFRNDILQTQALIERDLSAWLSV